MIYNDDERQQRTRSLWYLLKLVPFYIKNLFHFNIHPCPIIFMHTTTAIPTYNTEFFYKLAQMYIRNKLLQNKNNKKSLWWWSSSHCIPIDYFYTYPCMYWQHSRKISRQDVWKISYISYNHTIRKLYLSFIVLIFFSSSASTLSSSSTPIHCHFTL